MLHVEEVRGFSVNQPVILVRGGERLPANYRAVSDDTLYVEHCIPSPDGRADVRPGVYHLGDFDAMWPVVGADGLGHHDLVMHVGSGNIGYFSGLRGEEVVTFADIFYEDMPEKAVIYSKEDRFALMARPSQIKQTRGDA